MKHRITILLILPIAISGCAGYNHTLFMTKSNAGLDFDAKPPTVEITISRKEAVIAPGFEGGQTPPVMASFKPAVGTGAGFSNFFLGVDQTFAGGDAARTMAELYGTNMSPGASALTSYDSSIELTEPPKYSNWFQRMAKPGEVRPFIFGTDTMLGLKVAWSGTGGQMPDTLKAGFNRKEFAWAPVTMTTVTHTNSGTTVTNHLVKMPSFLATIDSKIEAGTDSKVSALQYFATGDAATLLAMQPAVREAMVMRMDPVSAGIAETEREKKQQQIVARSSHEREIASRSKGLRSSAEKLGEFFTWLESRYPRETEAIQQQVDVLQKEQKFRNSLLPTLTDTDQLTTILNKLDELLN